MSKHALLLAKAAIETIYETTIPYRENGTPTLTDRTVDLCNLALVSIEEELEKLKEL